MGWLDRKCLEMECWACLLIRRCMLDMKVARLLLAIESTLDKPYTLLTTITFYTTAVLAGPHLEHVRAHQKTEILQVYGNSP